MSKEDQGSVLNVGEFELDSLTVSEIIEIEEVLDGPIDKVFAALADGEGSKKGKALLVIGWLMRRREDPTFTMEQAGELRLVMTAGDEAEAQDEEAEEAPLPPPVPGA